MFSLMDLLPSSSNSWYTPENVLGGLLVGGQIWGNYNQNRQAQNQLDVTNSFNQQKLEEEKRQYDQTMAFQNQKFLEELALAKAEKAAKIKIARQGFIQGAYRNMSALARAGRQDEARSLEGIISALQRALLSPGGAQI